MYCWIFVSGFGMFPVAAQTSLLGVITDGQGSAVPEAIVTGRNADTTAVRKALTNSLGEYNMTQLQPGAYKVTVEKPGFRTHSFDIVLQVNTPATMDVKLELGAGTETANVMTETATAITEHAPGRTPVTAHR